MESEHLPEEADQGLREYLDNYNQVKKVLSERDCLRWQVGDLVLQIRELQQKDAPENLLKLEKRRLERLIGDYFHLIGSEP